MKLVVPTEAVPVIAPVLTLKDAHPGKDPTEMLHVYGGVPPVADGVKE